MGFQTWDSLHISIIVMNLFLSNCWLLVFVFLQDTAVKARFWIFFSVNYCFFSQFKFRPGIKFFKSRFRPEIELFKSRCIWIPGLKQTWNWEAEFQVCINKSIVVWQMNIFFFLLCLTTFFPITLTWKVSFFCLFPFFFLYTKRRPMCAQGKVFSLSDRGLRPYCIVHIIAQSQSCFCNACSSRSSTVATISLMQTGFCLPNGPLPFARFAMN